MISSRHICALIPTYNNGGTILDIVRRVAEQMHDIIVVVDGSTDDTVLLLKKERKVMGDRLTIVTLGENQGKGFALQQGFASAKRKGFTHVLTIDGDGQHYPEDIPALYRAHAIHPDAVIVGTRVLEQENMPQRNTFANRFSNFWFAAQTGLYLADTQCGFRIYPLSGILTPRLLTSRYEAELTLLVFATWANVPIVPVPVRVYDPPEEERVSHFRPAYDFTRISLLNIFLCALVLPYGLPRRWWRTLWYYTFFTLYLLLYVTPAMRLIQLRYGQTDTMNRHLHRFVQKNVKPLLFLIPDVPFRITGRPYNSKPAIYIANHNSHLDILTMMRLSNRLTFVGKEWVLKNPLFGRLAKGYHIIPATLDKDQLLEEIRRVTDLGYSVVIFPEGTRSTTGELQTFHRGAFYFADQLHLPIRPVVLRGLYDVWNKTTIHIGTPGAMEVIRMPEIGPDDPRRQEGYAKMSKRMAAEYRKWLDQYAYPFN